MAENTKIVISAVDKTARGLGAVTSRLKKVSGAIFSMRTALVGVAGAAGFGLLVKSSLNATNALAKTASKIGTTTEALSGLRYAADLTGVSTQTMDMALQRFTRRTAEAAKGTGEAKDVIRELGVDAKKLVKMPLDERMLVLADAFEKVDNEADRLRLAFKLFDSEGAALVNTLGLGRDGLAEMLGEAKALGVVMSSSAAKGVEDASDALSRLGFLFKGVTDQTVAAFAPAIEKLTTKFKEFLLKVTESEGGIEKFAKVMAESILNSVGTVLKALQTMVNGVITAFNELLIAKDNVTGFFTSDDEKNARQLRTEMEKINAAMAEREIRIEGLTARAKRSAELTQESDRKRLESLQKLLEKAEEIGDTELIPHLTFGDEFNSFINEIAASSQVMGVTGADAVNNISNALVKGTPLLQQYFDELKKLNDQLASGSITQEEYNKRKAEIERLIALEQRLIDFKNKTTTEQTQHVLGELSTQFSGVARNNKKLFELNKKLQIGQAIMNTYAGATKAFASYPPPLNFVMAAAVVASGLAQVAQIRAQSFDGGGFTGHGARSGGVDGKGGFPAILHPNETVVDHTKGQGNRATKGGDSIVINQTINVTTGVAQTVRAEIANLMPQITQAAKMAVADAQQRGGRLVSA